MIQIISRRVAILCLAATLAATLAGCTSSGQRAAKTSAAPPVPAAAPAANGYPPLARAGAATAANPSTAIVDVNRSNAAALGPNSPPPSRFENSCTPAPVVFQSVAGYEAVRLKDCRNDQLVYLPSSAQRQIDIYTADCQQRCAAR